MFPLQVGSATFDNTTSTEPRGLVVESVVIHVMCQSCQGHGHGRCNLDEAMGLDASKHA